MDTQGSITLLIHQMVEGNNQDWEEAAKEIHDKLSSRFEKLARRLLSKSIRRRIDPADISQSVFKSLFLRARDGRIEVFDREDLGSLLAAMTFNKVHRAVKHHVYKKRDINLETQSLNDLDALEDHVLTEALHSPEPAADLVLQMADELQDRLKSLIDPTLIETAILKIDGYSTDEIAKLLDCSPRTVERRIVVIRRRWSDLQWHDTHDSNSAAAK